MSFSRREGYGHGTCKKAFSKLKDTFSKASVQKRKWWCWPAMIPKMFYYISTMTAGKRLCTVQLRDSEMKYAQIEKECLLSAMGL